MSIPTHQEEVWEILEGELEITIAGVTHAQVPARVGIVPPNTLHTVKAVSPGKAIGTCSGSLVQLSGFVLVQCADQPLTRYRCAGRDHESTGSNM